MVEVPGFSVGMTWDGKGFKGMGGREGGTESHIHHDKSPSNDPIGDIIV